MTIAANRFDEASPPALEGVFLEVVPHEGIV